MAACPVGRVPPDMRKDGYFMKSMKRRLLSLFMAMVMVCSLVPGALAVDTLSLTATNGTITSGGTTNSTGFSLSGNDSIPQGATWTWSIESGKDAASFSGSTNTATPPTLTAADNVTTDTTVKVKVVASWTEQVNGEGEGQDQSQTPTEKSATAECEVTVKAKETPPPAVAESVTLSGGGLSNGALVLTAGGKAVTVNATVAPSTLTDKSVTWSGHTNNNPAIEVSTTDTSITITPKAATTTPITITATADTKGANNADVSASFTVTVNPDTTATIKPTANSMKLGGTQAVTLTTALTDAVMWYSSDTSVLTVVGNTNDAKTATITALKEGSAKIYAMIGSVKSNELTISVDKPIKLTITNNSSGSSAGSTLTGINSKLDLTVSTDVAVGSGVTITSVKWEQTNQNVVYLGGTTSTVVNVYATSVGSTTVTANVTLSNGQTASASVPIKVQSGANYSVSASVYVESSGYSLGDEDDKGKDSIIEQIDAKLGARYCKYVWFDTTTHAKGDLDAYKDTSHTTNKRYDVDEAADVVFTPDSSAKVGDVATFTLTVEDDKGTVYTFEVSFTLIEGTSAGDITYSAALGEDVYFDVSDFEDFYNDKYTSGYLEYVTFGSSSSNGTLYNEDGKTAGSTSYYVDPSKSSQKSLDGIYFSPKSSMKRSTTVKISFTARGTKRNDTGTGEVSGTVTIFYLNDSASDIVYNTTVGKVTLDPKDFNEAYKQATGSKTAPSNLTIEFQNVPSNGTLTYTGGSKDKDLTKSTVKSNRYTTKSSGTYRLAQLTYTGTKGKDTIDYIAYSGGTAQFSGKVVFNGTAAVPTDVVVTYGSTGGQAVRFSQNDFVSANSAMSKATKVRFVAPANGTLLMNGANASGVDIATTLLGTVTYQPKSGFNGQDKIIFAAYDASNNTVASGTVNITVIGNPTTGTTPGGTPGGVSDVSQFKDVSATAWYRDNLATLVRKGIITGKGDGKFDPLGTVTYGEALKMVLESCGYTAALGTGSQWAINYKNLAVSRGWISSDIDLNAAISRNATAELTAKVLGVSAVTSGSPFADEANGYAAALYYTSPQIFAGSPNPNGGKPLFKNSSPLLRQEVCAVICRVSDYHTQHTTNNMPDGI